MNHRFASPALALAIAVAAATAAQAQTTVPAGTSFGPLSVATFGGTGIPNTNVQQGGANGVVLGLSATQRYSSPPLTNNGHGTFFATPGISTGAPVNAGFADWNYDFYVGNSTANDFFTLFINPSPGSTLPAFPFSFTGDRQDSSNLGYFGPLFNPNASGVYSVSLYQYSDAARTQELAHVAINVDVTPEPSSMALLGTGLVGLAGFVKRRARFV